MFEELILILYLAILCHLAEVFDVDAPNFPIILVISGFQSCFQRTMDTLLGVCEWLDATLT